MFRFVQWEFAGRLGPEPGRYVVRRYAGDDARWIIVIGGSEAPPQRGRRKWHRSPGPEEPVSVPVTRATIIDAERTDEEEAARWLVSAGEEEAEKALAVLNGAVHAYRVAAVDPSVGEAVRARALACRVGYGSGEAVAEGAWNEARLLDPPSPKRDRTSVLRPQERTAAILSGRDVALACETMAVRARADLDAGRGREAAMQAHLALEAALSELQSYRGLTGMDERLAELDGFRDEAASLANSSLQGGLDADQTAAVERILSRLEAALRAKAVAGPY